MCYYIFIIEHIINYIIPCLLLVLEECGHLLDVLVAQQFQEGQYVFGTCYSYNIRLRCGRYHLRELD